MNVTQTAIHYLIWETVKNPPYLISCILNCSLVGLNFWEIAVNSTKGNEFFQQVLDSKSKVILEDAIFWSKQAFKPANLQDYLQFWEEEILLSSHTVLS